MLLSSPCWARCWLCWMRRSRRNPESPDGKWLVVLQDQNLHLRAKDTGEEFPLSTDGRADDRYDLGELWWSPDSQKLVALRTTPPENPHIWEEPRFQKAETRPITHWGVSSGTGPIAAPGAYIARLTVDGESLVQPIEVLLPPSNTGTAADIQESVKLQLRIRDHITAVAGLVPWAPSGTRISLRAVSPRASW